ncbi:MAG: hypothetical protein WBA78_11815, partial [Castellaniella sp.]
MNPPFYAFAGGLAMGCGMVAGWGAVGPAVAAGACTGLVLSRWARDYADRLDAGAPATARTLWASLAAAPFRPWRPVRD